jgi:hypothetical protein
MLGHEVNAQSSKALNSETKKDVVIGAWIPSQLYLERMEGDKQANAIHSLVSKGIDEYYFVMKDFNDNTETKATEELLKQTDIGNLKVFIILLPWAEGGTHVSYDWKGWMNYFNSLKEKHPSFMGFVVDDFNALVDIRRIYVMNNIDLMRLSDFASALSYKREDVQFFPVMYVETGEFETLKRQYSEYTDGIVLVSTLYQNVSYLENSLENKSKLLHNKPIKFIVYPTTGNFYSSSDRLIMATLSIASRWSDGIIIYRNITNPVVQEFISDHTDPQYVSSIMEMEKLQVRREIIESRRDIVMCTFCLYQNK